MTVLTGAGYLTKASLDEVFIGTGFTKEVAPIPCIPLVMEEIDWLDNELKPVILQSKQKQAIA